MNNCIKSRDGLAPRLLSFLFFLPKEFVLSCSIPASTFRSSCAAPFCVADSRIRDILILVSFRINSEFSNFFGIFFGDFFLLGYEPMFGCDAIICCLRCDNESETRRMNYAMLQVDIGMID